MNRWGGGRVGAAAGLLGISVLAEHVGLGGKILMVAGEEQ